MIKYKPNRLLALNILLSSLACSHLCFAGDKPTFIRAEIHTRNPELNGSYTIQLQDKRTQRFSFPINNHYFYLTARVIDDDTVEVHMTAITDTDHVESKTMKHVFVLKPGIRNRFYLRGPLIKRAPFELTLQRN